jgi:hypothetical protein
LLTGLPGGKEDGQEEGQDAEPLLQETLFPNGLGQLGLRRERGQDVIPGRDVGATKDHLAYEPWKKGSVPVVNEKDGGGKMVCGRKMECYLGLGLLLGEREREKEWAKRGTI